ncbi:cadmium-translocating P-type ATPase [Patescibacteria group bacterium]|nr:cadmium-translocating P-type ATPase [Patescibacteria group bacterium]
MDNHPQHKNMHNGDQKKHSSHQDHSKMDHSQMNNKKIKHVGHHDHHKMMAQDFKKRFYISLVFTIPVLILSPLIQKVLKIEFTFIGDQYLLLILSTFLYFYGGRPFLKGIVEELKKKQPGMMTLVALAISVAYLYSVAVVFGLEGKLFFWELATLIDVMLLGHWMEMKSVIGASKALEKLAQLLPDTAHLIKNNEAVDIKISELKQGDIVLVKAGEKIPADGIIVKGESYIDESMLTGESKPVKKKEGDKLIGGSINGDSVVNIKVEGIGEDSYLSKVINLVNEAQQAKSKTQKLADKAAMWLTITSISLGTITFFTWLYFGKDFAFAVERMATVMVITCPHALGLAIPLVVAVSTSKSAKNGLLIRNRTQFENSRKITTVIFDKTGTLTEGKFGISKIESFNKEFNEDRLLQLASSLEQSSEHPIAKGIIKEAKEKNIKNLMVDNFKVLKGKGVEGNINNNNYKIVSPGFLTLQNIKQPKFETDDSSTDVFVIKDDEVVGLVSLSDKIRESSFQAIKKLQDINIKCWMLTGDNNKVAEVVSKKLNLDGYFAQVLPDQKQEKIKELQNKGEFVAMTGDGINDAPALAQADVGIAIGSGTDVAAETADIILVNSDPLDVTSLILFGKATYRKMLQNLFWATGYNIIAIPLAAGVFYSAGILISPAIGAAFMSLSTIVVAVNAQFLNVKNN